MNGSIFILDKEVRLAFTSKVIMTEKDHKATLQGARAVLFLEPGHSCMGSCIFSKLPNCTLKN